MWSWTFFLAMVGMSVFSYRRRGPRGSFHDWVHMDPDERRERWRQMQAEPELPAVVNQVVIRRLVNALLLPELDPQAWRRLDKLGVRAVPELVAALSDPRFLTAPEPDDDDHPLETVIGILGWHRAPAAVPPMAPLSGHPVAVVRQWAAWALASMGCEEGIEPLRGVLEWGDEDEWESAMTGIEVACRDGRATAAYRAALFDLLAPQVAENRGPASAYKLVELDRERAREFLVGILRPDHPRAATALHALADDGLSVPRDLLASIVSYAERNADHGLLAAAVGVCGVPEQPGDEERLRAFLTHPSLDVQQHVVAGLLRRRGVRDAFAAADGHEKVAGWASLSTPEQHYLAAQRLDWEVCNGGFSQYFFNSWGGQAQAAQAGLVAMNMDDAAGAVRRAIALFGGDGMPADRDERTTRLSAILRADKYAFDPLGSEYYRANDPLELELGRYALANWECFQHAPAPEEAEDDA